MVSVSFISHSVKPKKILKDSFEEYKVMSPKHYFQCPKMQILNIKWCHFYKEKEKRGKKCSRIPHASWENYAIHMHDFGYLFPHPASGNQFVVSERRLIGSLASTGTLLVAISKNDPLVFKLRQ